MFFDTSFYAFPNCLLALPTVFAIDFMSTFERLGLPSERGTGTPRIRLRCMRPRISIPPATPTAVTPTATAGPFALPATFLIVPAMPLSF